MRRFGGLPCPVLGCGRTVPDGRIMCGSCWKWVPTTTKLALWDHAELTQKAELAARSVAYWDGQENGDRYIAPADRERALLAPFLRYALNWLEGQAQREAFECKGVAT